MAWGLTGRRLTAWRDARDFGLYHWSPSGITFQVTEQDPALFPKFEPGDEADDFAAFKKYAVHPYLRLMKMTTRWYNTVDAVGTWTTDTDPGSVVLIKFGKLYFGATRWTRRYLVAHEVGHALGLNHRYPPDDSLMRGDTRHSLYPDDHDIGSLTSYYFPLG